MCGIPVEFSFRTSIRHYFYIHKQSIDYMHLPLPIFSSSMSPFLIMSIGMLYFYVCLQIVEIQYTRVLTYDKF